MSSVHFIAALDIGQARDFSALAIVEDISPLGTPASSKDKMLHLRRLERWSGIPYPETIRRVEKYLTDPVLKGRCVFVIDCTGVGKPVADDLLLEKRIVSPEKFFGILIHGGATVTQKGRIFNVPKRDLVTVGQIALENGRTKFAAGMHNLDVLVREMRDFRVKINPATAHDSYSHWREAAHDDLVLAYCMAVWAAGRAGTTSRPLMTRKESYWTGADGPREAARVPIEGRNGWHRVDDPALGLWVHE